VVRGEVLEFNAPECRFDVKPHDSLVALISSQPHGVLNAILEPQAHVLPQKQVLGIEGEATLLV
jgi:hypothetical protein